MGLISHLGAFTRAMPNVWRATRSTDTTADALLWGDQLWSVPSSAGVEINQQTALGAVCVMACVMMLTEDVAKLPVSHHPGGVYEARNIIHSTFDEMRAEIVENLEKAVLDAAGRASEE